MTFDYIKATDLFFKFFEKTKHFLRSFNVADTGIHIHINRKSLSLSDIGKIIQFINSSSNKFTMLVFNVTEPLLAPIRTIIPANRSGLDFSALILFIILNFLKSQLLLIG